MVDSGSLTCPEQESAGCHFGTLEEFFLLAKIKMATKESQEKSIFICKFSSRPPRCTVLVSTPRFSGSIYVNCVCKN